VPSAAALRAWCTRPPCPSPTSPGPTVGACVLPGGHSWPCVASAPRAPNIFSRALARGVETLAGCEAMIFFHEKMRKAAIGPA